MDGGSRSIMAIMVGMGRVVSQGLLGGTALLGGVGGPGVRSPSIMYMFVCYSKVSYTMTTSVLILHRTLNWTIAGLVSCFLSLVVGFLHVVCVFSNLQLVYT